MHRRASTTLIALLAVVLAASPALPAAAAGGIELSDDGVTYGSVLPGPLFSGIGSLVPMGGESQTFWVRNSSGMDARLRLSLDDAAWSNGAYANALSLAASVPGAAGSAIRLSAASGCSILLDGVELAAGESIAVTTTIALGNLNGSTGQGSTASMNIGVTLTEAAGPAPGTGCATPPTTVVVVPRAPVAAEEDEAVVAPEQPAGEETPAPQDPLALVLANTFSGFDGGLVALAGAAVPIGAAVFFLVGLGRRRRGLDEEWEEELP